MGVAVRLRASAMPASATQRKPATPASARSRYMRRLTRFQTHAAPAARTARALADQLDPGGAQRIHQLHQRIDIAAHDAIARLHALNGRHRQAGDLGKAALVDAEQSASRLNLPG